MGYLWDRYGFVRRYRYLWQKERAEAISRHYRSQGTAQGVGQIGAVKDAIDMQKLVNELKRLRADDSVTTAASPGRKPRKDVA